MCDSLPVAPVRMKVVNPPARCGGVSHQGCLPTEVLGATAHCRGMGCGPCLPQGLLRYLHVGDFRWTAAMAEEAALRGLPLDILFLDTTYSNPRHTHPPQARPAASWASSALPVG